MSRRVLLLLALAAAMAGCATGGGAFRCPAKGGAEWHELRTENFVLRTDHPARTARALALELERLRDAIVAGLLEAPPRRGAPVQVIIVRSQDTWNRLSRADTAGLYTQSLWGEPTIVLPAELGLLQRRTIAHELTHMLTATDGPRQPLWFREGLACYAETVQFRGPEGNVMLGVAARDRALFYYAIRGNMRAVLTARDDLAVGQYGLAWLLVHFLLNDEPERLGQLEDRYARGEDPQAAWRAVFPEWDPDAPDGMERLESALAAYGDKEAKAYVYAHPRLASIPPPRERTLSSAEVHDLRLALPWPNRGQELPREVRLAEAKEALEEDPGAPTAVALLGSEPGADRRALAERATRARPADARNWVLLGLATKEDVAGREAAFRRAVEVDASSLVALDALARFLVEHGRAKEAVAPAREAVQRAPWDPSALSGAAAVLDALGDCRGALPLQERAVDALPERAPAEARRPLVLARDRLRAACGRP